jgi:hypothetical protein
MSVSTIIVALNAQLLGRVLDVRGSVPTNVYVIGGQVHDVNLLSLNVLMLPDSRTRTGIRTFLNC